MAIPAAALNAYAQAARMGGSGAAMPVGGGKEVAGGGNFGDFLKNAINETVNTGKTGEQQMAVSTAGKEGSLVDVVTAVAEAEASLQTVVAVRDKVIAAYQDIMRMPI
ncbi:MAG: flagellar hook-basal body complex protein FliE [Parvibaculum sp.]|nr:flagellar hook-basal body complex protein FliE [Parvibaculum sp.]